MAPLVIYLGLGCILMVSLVTDVQFAKRGLLTSPIECFVFIWAWPAMLFVMLLFPFCRPEGTDPTGTL